MSNTIETINSVLQIQGLDLAEDVFDHNSLGNFLIECRDEIEQLTLRNKQLEAALRYYAKDYENPFGGDDSLVARAALGDK